MFEDGMKLGFGIVCVYGAYKFIQACENGTMKKAYDSACDSVKEFFGDKETKAEAK